ncbi:hypothetical protein [Bradyrhizobium septentrionale]|uniref:Phage tail tape measure protein domain-containing protein n=1 Tax=Bradyrhizobium septentrionale TaxID=1404411 RepID=A0ABZ2P8C8_9BRAD
MAKIIEAKAVISAEDKTGAIFDKIAKKVENIAKSAKASVQVDRLAKAMDSVQKQMAAIDRYGTARTRYDGALKQMRLVEAEARRVDGVIKSLGSAADQKAGAAEMKRVSAAVDSATRSLERERSAALAARRALSELGVPISGAIAHQDRLRAAVDRANAALERQPGRVSKAAGAAVRGVGRGAAAVLPFAGPAIVRGTVGAARAGAEIQSEVVKMRAAGIPEDDIQRALGETAGLMPQYTNVKRSDALERFKELRSIVLHPEEAHELLPTAIKANSAVNALDRSGHMAEGLGFAFKGAEVLGRAQDPTKFEHYLDSFIRAQQVMGKTITPEQVYELAKYTKASGSTLSDRFLNTSAMSLAQELGGSTTGVSIDQFVKQITGGFQGNLHSAAKEFVNLGLANKDDFETTKTGEIKGMKPGRHVAGAALAQTDPDRYVYEHLLPALEKAGITDQNAQIAQVRRMFPSGRAADLVSKLITQRQSFENHGKLYEKAQGLDAVGNNQSDPFVALNSLTTSLTNFSGALTSPVMKDAAGIMSTMAASLGSWGESLANFQKEHPEAAKWIGGGALAAGFGGGTLATGSLLYNLTTGFGLPASAVALDTSAAALSTAAAELSAAALGGKVANAAVPAAVATGAGVGSGARASVWAAGARAIPLPLAVPAAIGAGAWWFTGGDEGRGTWWAPSDPETAKRRRQHGETVRNAYRNRFLDDDRRWGITGDYAAPELTPTMTYGTGVAGDHGLVTAQLTGSAEVHGEAKLTVEAGSELIRIAEQAKQAIKMAGQLNASGPGSTGKSSPDAAAPVLGGVGGGGL